MGNKAGDEATFAINLEGNAAEVSDETAESLEHLREKVATGQQALRNMSGALRSLRGSTEEVKAAKAALKAKIDAERDAMSAANLTMLKSGATYEQLAAKAKKAAIEKAKLEDKKKADGLKQATDRADAVSGAMKR